MDSNVSLYMVFSLGVILVFSIGTTQAQIYQSYISKPGLCPPPVISSRCSRACGTDLDCGGEDKCCPTICGRKCSRPDLNKRLIAQKEGRCPVTRQGMWICSNRCNEDEDCIANFKCCLNRCGALACMLPDYSTNFY